jgi:hypothetical protein
MVLDNDKFMEFVFKWVEKENADIDDIFRIQERDGNIMMDLPELFYRDFNDKFPDFDLEKTMNSYISHIFEDIIKNPEKLKDLDVSKLDE